MHLVALNLLLHLYQILFDLLGRHAQSPRHNRHTNSMQARHEILPHPSAQKFILLPSRPRTNRERRPPLDDIHKSNLLQHVRILAGIREILPQGFRAGHESPTPVLQRAAVAARVEEAHRQVAVLQFEVAAGAQGVECVREDDAVGAKAGYERAAVDVVECLREEPWVFGVVDFEGAVGWDAGVGLAGCSITIMGVAGTNVVGWMGLKSVPMTFADG